MIKRIWLGVLVALIGALVAFGAACGGDGDGDDGDSAEVEAAIQAVIDAWNGKDVDAFLAAVTDAFLQEEFEVSRADAAEELGGFIGDPPITLGEFSNTQVSGDTGSTEAVVYFANAGAPNRLSVVREGDVWLLDATEQVVGEVPEGTTAVDLTLTEYRFTFDAEAIADGNVAFNVSNIGGEQHEVAMGTIPADAEVEELIRSEEEPEGFEFVGFVDPLDSGAETTMLFQEPLGPGRYLMVCFVEAADGEPHAFKGMWAEFTIE
jgi:hypothetical protein